jgi:hypothetical protein
MTLLLRRIRAVEPQIEMQINTGVSTIVGRPAPSKIHPTSRSSSGLLWQNSIYYYSLVYDTIADASFYILRPGWTGPSEKNDDCPGAY